MFDMMKMMGQLKDVQSKMKEAQDELKKISAESESGAGLVRVKVNGHKEVLSLEIDDSLLNKEDSQMMKDLIIAAVNKAMAEIEIKSKEHMKSATQGMIPNIPGFDLNNMM